MSSDAPVERVLARNYQFSAARVEAAFAEQELQHWGQAARFKVVELDSVVINSGVVVPGDPVSGSMNALKRHIPPGTYPMSVALVRMPSGDERVAFVRLLLSPAPVVTWEAAWHEPVTEYVRQQAVRREYAFYFSEGVGAFMDAAAVTAIRRCYNENFMDRVMDGLDANYRETWSWFSFKPDPTRPENVVCYRTEPGGRHSHFGLDAQGNPAVIVTDCA